MNIQHWSQTGRYASVGPPPTSMRGDYSSQAADNRPEKNSYVVGAAIKDRPTDPPRPSRSPGPGSYSPERTGPSGIKKNTPAFSFGARTNQRNGRDDIPGPGSYSPEKSGRRKTGPSFGSRHKALQDASLPGPAAYDVRPQTTRSGPAGGPQYSLGGRADAVADVGRKHGDVHRAAAAAAGNGVGMRGGNRRYAADDDFSDYYSPSERNQRHQRRQNLDGYFDEFGPTAPYYGSDRMYPDGIHSRRGPGGQRASYPTSRAQAVHPAAADYDDYYGPGVSGRRGGQPPPPGGPYSGFDVGPAGPAGYYGAYDSDTAAMRRDGRRQGGVTEGSRNDRNGQFGNKWDRGDDWSYNAAVNRSSGYGYPQRRAY